MDTKYYLQKNNIFAEQKLSLLRDPVINISEIQKLKNDKIEKELLNKRYFIAVGRLTEQKNHNFLLNRNIILHVVLFVYNFHFLV